MDVRLKFEAAMHVLLTLNNAFDEENIVAALEYADRVCDVNLKLMGSELEKISTVMREPYPVLTNLYIASSESHGISLPLPGEFLGGSAPRLRSTSLYGIFPFRLCQRFF